MSGPWYEETGPTTEEVTHNMLEAFGIPIKKIGKFKKHQVADIIKVVNDVVSVEEKKYNGWGSYRGWATVSPDLIEKISVKLNQLTEARNKINKFIMNSDWVMDMLYRPPTETRPAGRMYKLAESSFYSISSANIPKQYPSEI